MDNLSREKLLGYIKKQKARIKQLETENDVIIKEKDGLKSINDSIVCEHDSLKVLHTQLIQENEVLVKGCDRHKHELEIVNEKLQILQEQLKTEISSSNVLSQIVATVQDDVITTPINGVTVVGNSTIIAESTVTTPMMSIWDGLRYNQQPVDSSTNSSTAINDNNNISNTSNGQLDQKLMHRLSKASLSHFIRLLDHKIEQQHHQTNNLSCCFYQWKGKVLAKKLQATESSLQSIQESSAQTIQQLETSLESNKECSKETIHQLEVKIHKLKALLARTHQSKQKTLEDTTQLKKAQESIAEELKERSMREQLERQSLLETVRMQTIESAFQQDMEIVIQRAAEEMSLKQQQQMLRTHEQLLMQQQILQAELEAYKRKNNTSSGDDSEYNNSSNNINNNVSDIILHSNANSHHHNPQSPQQHLQLQDNQHQQHLQQLQLSEQYEKQINQHMSEIKQYKEMSEKYQQEIDALKSRLQEETSTRSDLEIEIQLLLSSRNTIIQQIETSSTAHLTAEITTLQDSLIQLKTTHNETLEQYTDLKESYNTIMNDYSNIQNLYNTSKKECQLLRSENYQIKSSLLEYKKSSAAIVNNNKRSNNTTSSSNDLTNGKDSSGKNNSITIINNNTTATNNNSNTKGSITLSSLECKQLTQLINQFLSLVTESLDQQQQCNASDDDEVDGSRNIKSNKKNTLTASSILQELIRFTEPYAAYCNINVANNNGIDHIADTATASVPNNSLTLPVTANDDSFNSQNIIHRLIAKLKSDLESKQIEMLRLTDDVKSMPKGTVVYSKSNDDNNHNDSSSSNIQSNINSDPNIITSNTNAVSETSPSLNPQPSQSLSPLMTQPQHNIIQPLQPMVWEAHGVTLNAGKDMTILIPSFNMTMSQQQQQQQKIMSTAETEKQSTAGDAVLHWTIYSDTVQYITLKLLPVADNTGSSGGSSGSGRGNNNNANQHQQQSSSATLFSTRAVQLTQGPPTITGTHSVNSGSTGGSGTMMLKICNSALWGSVKIRYKISLTPPSSSLSLLPSPMSAPLTQQSLQDAHSQSTETSLITNITQTSPSSLVTTITKQQIISHNNSGSGTDDHAVVSNKGRLQKEITSLQQSLSQLQSLSATGTTLHHDLELYLEKFKLRQIQQQEYETATKTKFCKQRKHTLQQLSEYKSQFNKLLPKLSFDIKGSGNNGASPLSNANKQLTNKNNSKLHQLHSLSSAAAAFDRFIPASQPIAVYVCEGIVIRAGQDFRLKVPFPVVSIARENDSNDSTSSADDVMMKNVSRISGNHHQKYCQQFLLEWEISLLNDSTSSNTKTSTAAAGAISPHTTTSTDTDATNINSNNTNGLTIGFSVMKQECDGLLPQVIPYSKLTANGIKGSLIVNTAETTAASALISDYEDSSEISTPASALIYIFLLDNSFSWYRSKQVRYRVQLTELHLRHSESEPVSTTPSTPQEIQDTNNTASNSSISESYEIAAQSNLTMQELSNGNNEIDILVSAQINTIESNIDLNHDDDDEDDEKIVVKYLKNVLALAQQTSSLVLTSPS